MSQQNKCHGCSIYGCERGTWQSGYYEVYDFGFKPLSSPLHFVFRLETFSFVSSSSHNLGLHLLFQEQTTSTGRLQYSNS